MEVVTIVVLTMTSFLGQHVSRLPIAVLGVVTSLPIVVMSVVVVSLVTVGVVVGGLAGTVVRGVITAMVVAATVTVTHTVETMFVVVAGSGARPVVIQAEVIVVVLVRVASLAVFDSLVDFGLRLMTLQSWRLGHV